MFILSAHPIDLSNPTAVKVWEEKIELKIEVIGRVYVYSF